MCVGESQSRHREVRGWLSRSVSSGACSNPNRATVSLSQMVT